MNASFDSNDSQWRSGGSTKTFDQAMHLTINRNRPKCFFHMFVQNTSFLLITMGILSCNPIILGMHFLQREPKYYKCWAGSKWEPCSKRQICLGSYSKDSYVPISDTSKDSEFIDNWVDRMNLLCEPSFIIGLMGFSFFVGIILALFVVP